MGGTAKDFGQMMTLLMHDEILRGLMLVPVTTPVNYNTLLAKYFIEAFTSEVLTDDGVCRLVIKSAPQLSIGSQYVKEDNVIIEVFVPNTKDRVAGFERRSNQIIDQIIILFTKKKKNAQGIIPLDSALINGRRMVLEGRNELASGSVGFKRQFVQFSYKKIY